MQVNKRLTKSALQDLVDNAIDFANPGDNEPSYETEAESRAFHFGLKVASDNIAALIVKASA